MKQNKKTILPTYREKPKYGHFQDHRLIKNVVILSIVMLSIFGILCWIIIPERNSIVRSSFEDDNDGNIHYEGGGGGGGKRFKLRNFENPSDYDRNQMKYDDYDTNINIQIFRSDKVNKMTYQFSENFNITNTDLIYVFSQPRDKKMIAMKQDMLASYRLCCSIFKLEPDIRDRSKLIGDLCSSDNSKALQCIIQNEYLIAKIDLSQILDFGNTNINKKIITIIAHCIFKWNTFQD